jgi:hypothetical protein
MKLLTHCIAVAALIAASACGGADIGESCDDVGSTDECVDDAICTNESDDHAACRALCEEQADCPADHGCNGISGSSRKSCQPD